MRPKQQSGRNYLKQQQKPSIDPFVKKGWQDHLLAVSFAKRCGISKKNILFQYATVLREKKWPSSVRVLCRMYLVWCARWTLPQRAVCCEVNTSKGSNTFRANNYLYNITACTGGNSWHRITPVQKTTALARCVNRFFSDVDVSAV